MANSTHVETKEDTSGLWQQSHRDWSIWRAWGYLALLTCISGGGLLLAGDSAASNYFGDVLNGSWKAYPQPLQKIQVIREYDLQTGVRWMNPGASVLRSWYMLSTDTDWDPVPGRWRQMEGHVCLQRAVTMPDAACGGRRHSQDRGPQRQLFSIIHPLVSMAPPE